MVAVQPSLEIPGARAKHVKINSMQGALPSQHGADLRLAFAMRGEP